jgi:hypothetical protein
MVALYLLCSINFKTKQFSSIFVTSFPDIQELQEINYPILLQFPHLTQLQKSTPARKQATRSIPQRLEHLFGTPYLILTDVI